jgi:hypothetical protein
LIVPLILALVQLYLDKKITKRYGGYVVKPIKASDDFARFTKEGKPLPSLSEVRQKRIKGLLRFSLWTIAVVGIIVFILRKLGW